MYSEDTGQHAEPLGKTADQNGYTTVPTRRAPSQQFISLHHDDVYVRSTVLNRLFCLLIVFYIMGFWDTQHHGTKSDNVQRSAPFKVPAACVTTAPNF